MTTHKERVLEFWNSRADHGENAGSNDFMLKELEERALLQRVPRGSHVLDIGCGNGATLVRLIDEKVCTGVGVDYADRLLQLALKRRDQRSLQSKVTFLKGDVMRLPSELARFDHVLTQRCLINLETPYDQAQAFEKILDRLNPGGLYYMIEAFHDGNRALNSMREPLGLEAMTAPWHNCFLELNDVVQWEKRYPAKLQEVAHFASTYYFLSRVVYAKLAADKNEPLRYDSDINRLSVELPSIGDFGATKLLVWQKAK